MQFGITRELSPALDMQGHLYCAHASSSKSGLHGRAEHWQPLRLPCCPCRVSACLLLSGVGGGLAQPASPALHCTHAMKCPTTWLGDALLHVVDSWPMSYCYVAPSHRIRPMCSSVCALLIAATTDDDSSVARRRALLWCQLSPVQGVAGRSQMWSG